MARFGGEPERGLVIIFGVGGEGWVFLEEAKDGGVVALFGGDGEGGAVQRDAERGGFWGFHRGGRGKLVVVGTSGGSGGMSRTR